jgi:hypothetical protein
MVAVFRAMTDFRTAQRTPLGSPGGAKAISRDYLKKWNRPPDFSMSTEGLEMSGLDGRVEPVVVPPVHVVNGRYYELGRR